MKLHKLTAILVLLWATIPSAQTKTGFFTTSDGVRIHYLEAGNGPVMVLIPGWTMPADIWENQIAYFGRNHRVIAVDPRSQGESDKVTDGNYPERRAQDYRELMQSLKLPPAVLVGWSMAVPELMAYVDRFAYAAAGTGQLETIGDENWVCRMCRAMRPGPEKGPEPDNRASGASELRARSGVGVPARARVGEFEGAKPLD